MRLDENGEAMADDDYRRGDDDGAGGGHRRMMHPRSPRQAIAPERMPPPPSRRARHPLVVVGDAIPTIIVLAIIAVGAGLYVGKGEFESAGPLDRERTVVIPRGTGIREVAELLRRERVIDTPIVFVIG